MNRIARKTLSVMPRPKPPLTGPMSVQPVEHGSVTLMQLRPMTTVTNDKPKASRKQSARADAVRIAKAKISRRDSLSKQRQALKG